LLSLYHCQIIRPLVADFIGQCCPKQGMANSPAMCQEFVAAAIEPMRCKYPKSLCASLHGWHSDKSSQWVYIFTNLGRSYKGPWGLRIVHCSGKGTKNASHSIFRASYWRMLDPSSKSRDQEGQFKNLKWFTKTSGRYQLAQTLPKTYHSFQLLKGDPNPSLLWEFMEDSQQALFKIVQLLQPSFSTGIHSSLFHYWFYALHQY
jgi:hypothetical protein